MTPARQRIAAYGEPRSPSYVRVFREHDAVRVQWGRPLQTKSFPDDRDGVKLARAFAQGVAAEQAAGRSGQARLTLRDVWLRYRAAHFPNLRPNTQEHYDRDYALVSGIIGPTKKADAVKIPDFDRVRETLRADGLAHRTISEAIKTIKRVWTWAEQRELIARNPLYSYRYTIPKDERTAPAAEYTLAEWTAIRATLDPTKAHDWRAWVALTICGAQGARQHAVLHLQLADFADAPEPVIVWRAAWDKTGKEWTQPLRADTVAALAVAKHHHARMGYAGPWLLPPGKQTSTEPVYDNTSLWYKLRRAEDAAGVAHQARRAGHGARRMIAGDVWEMTGDALLALRAIGDSDPKMLARYLAKRDGRMRDVFDRLDAPNISRTSDANRNGTATETLAPRVPDPSTQEN